MSFTTRWRLTLAGVAIALAGSAQAQFSSGLEGTISDPAGAVVPGAAVLVTTIDTGLKRTVQTSSSGYFRVASLSPAPVRVTVSAPGFKTSVLDDVALGVGEIRTINFRLEVGTSETSVTVTETLAAVESSEGRISGVIQQSKVEQMPLVGRNSFALVTLTPGVTGLVNGGSQSFASSTGDIFAVEYGVGLGANGLRSSGNNFMVDSGSTNDVSHGGTTNLSPNAESVQEVRIQTNTFSAQYGRGNSVIIDIVTKQGTNSLHGSASWFHANDRLTSRNIFQAKVPGFHRNEAAWSLGGPIRKNSTFFFGSMDILRSGVAQARPVRLETPQFLDFLRRAKPNAISTGLLGKYPADTPVTQNFRTAGDFASVNCASLASPDTAIPTAAGNMPCNLPVTGEGNFSATLPRNGVQYNTRIDQFLNDQKDRVYGSFFYTTLDRIFTTQRKPGSSSRAFRAVTRCS